MRNAHDLTALRILIAEDDPMLAAQLKNAAEDAGAVAMGPVATVDDGCALIDSGSIDAAIRDINLSGEMSYGLADDLLARGRPVVFATGYNALIIPGRYASIPRFAKPVLSADIVSMLAVLLDRRGSNPRTRLDSASGTP